MSKDELIDLILKKEEVIEKIKKEKENIEKEKEKIEKELRKYKNSNTPSSSNKHLQRNTRGLQAKKGTKCGAPKGHKGKTRQLVPDRKEIVDTDECPYCGSDDIEDEKVLKRTVEEIPKPVIPETTESEIHVKHCKTCDRKFIPPQNTTPLKGKFGINIMVMVILMRYLLRGVLRKSAYFLETGFALKIVPASVNAIIKRVAEAATKEYEQLKKRIREAKLVYVDETSFSVLGIMYWVWVFRAADDILLVIRPSRGNNVLDEILGKDYSGVVTCDCWRAYDFLSKAHIQRCWSHLLRKSKALYNTVVGRHFHEKLKALFEEIKVFNESNPTQEQRLKKYNEMTRGLKKLVSYYSHYEDLNSVTKYINFHIEQWFTCIKIEGVEPTNNFAEQAIRETVMVRKIIGAFRSEKGTQYYETLASLISSWQLKGLDLQSELRKMLIKNLCFC